MKKLEKNWAYLIFILSTVFLFILIAPGFHEAYFPIDDHGLFSQSFLQNPWRWQSFKIMFTPGYSADYYPIRDLSTWLDWSFGTNLTVDTTIPQIQNFLWLVATALLLFVLLNQLYAKPLVNSLLASAWMLHPFHFESLHWISARKDLMSWFFILAACALFLKLVRAPHIKWTVLVCICFLCCLLSKAGFLAMPFAALAWFLWERYRHRRQVHALVWWTLGSAALLSIFMVLVTYWNYTASNYMQMTEESTVRFLSVLAAFGRNIVGVFIPTFNAVDVEPWGGWYLYNTQYISIGVFGALLLLMLTWLSLKKERADWRVYLIIIFAILLMTPGFNPKHRNYYSIRYFEPILFVLWVWCASYFKNTQKGTLAATTVLLLVAGVAYWDSDNWNSNYAIMAKSYSVSPKDPSVRSMLLFEYHNLDTWGRLSKEERRDFQSLFETNKQECVENETINDRCLTFLVRLNPLLKKFPPSPEHREEIKKRVLQRVVNIKERVFSEVSKSEVAFSVFHSRLQSGYFDLESLKKFFAGHPTQTDDFSRVRFLLMQCLEEGPEKAQQIYQSWVRDYILNPNEVAEFITQMPNENLRQEVQRCFGTQNSR